MGRIVEIPITQRFYSHTIIANSGCRLWTGSKNIQGYGRFNVGKHRVVSTHRLSWYLSFGAIPPNALVLHKCRNKNCVNVDHLYLGNQSQNMLDAVRDGTHNIAGRFRERCKRGHLYSYRNKRGVAICRECRRLKKLENLDV